MSLDHSVVGLHVNPDASVGYNGIGQDVTYLFVRHSGRSSKATNFVFSASVSVLPLKLTGFYGHSLTQTALKKEVGNLPPVKPSGCGFMSVNNLYL